MLPQSGLNCGEWFIKGLHKLEEQAVHWNIYSLAITEDKGRQYREAKASFFNDEKFVEGNISKKTTNELFFSWNKLSIKVTQRNILTGNNKVTESNPSCIKREIITLFSRDLSQFLKLCITSQVPRTSMWTRMYTTYKLKVSLKNIINLGVDWTRFLDSKRLLNSSSVRPAKSPKELSHVGTNSFSDDIFEKGLVNT